MSNKKRNGMQDCAIRLILLFLLGTLVTSIVLAGIAYDRAQKVGNGIRYCNLITMVNATDTNDQGVNMFVSLEITPDYLAYEIKSSGDRILESVSITGPYGLTATNSNSTFITIIRSGTTELKEDVSLTGKMNFEILPGGITLQPDKFKLKLAEVLKYVVMYSLELRDDIGGYSSNIIVNAC
jgi:hypothetical protein